MKTIAKPNFLYLGPDKSGSSWIFEILRQHPQVFVPACKDVYYFDQQFERGPDWYLEFFAKAPAEALARGEISHSYLFSAKAAERIGDFLPGVKLFSSLRNPVDRCFSHYLYLRSSGLVSKPFEAVLEERPGLIRSSLYADPVAGYQRRFPPEQLQFLLFDDLERDARAYAFQIFRFLGVECSEKIDYGAKVRPARRARSEGLARLVKWGALRAREQGLTRLVGALKSGPLSRLLYQPYAKEQKPTMALETRNRLCEFFAPDLERLSGLIGRNLSHWIEPPET